MANLTIKRIGYACGSEITGVDLRAPLDDATIARIRAAWLEKAWCWSSRAKRSADFAR